MAGGAGDSALEEGLEEELDGQGPGKGMDIVAELSKLQGMTKEQAEAYLQNIEDTAMVRRGSSVLVVQASFSHACCLPVMHMCCRRC